MEWTSSPQKFYLLFLSHAIESLPNINLPKRVRTKQAKTLWFWSFVRNAERIKLPSLWWLWIPLRSKDFSLTSILTTFFDQTPISSVTLNSLVVKRLSDRDVKCNSPFQSAMKTQRSTIFSQLFRLNLQPNMKSYIFFQIINFAAFIEDYVECSPLLMEKCCPYLIAMFDMFQVPAPAIPERLSSIDCHYI